MNIPPQPTAAKVVELATREANCLMPRIVAALASMNDLPGDFVNWGHANSASHALQQLRDIAAFLNA